MRTFRGATLEECFLQVKAEMGREAVILQSKTYKPIFGRFGKDRHEVVAALDLNIADTPATAPSRDPSVAPSRPKPASQAPTAARPPERGVYGYSTGPVERPAARPAPRQVDPPIQTGPQPLASPPFDTRAYDERMERLENQLSSLASSMTKLSEAAMSRRTAKKSESAKGYPLEGIEPATPYANVAKRLADAEVAAPLIRILMEDMPKGLDDAAAATELRTRISQRLILTDVLEAVPGKMRVMAFLGATGVGKTTTLTKIAARLSLISNYSVGVLTMDTHRIAAAKQLETYGEILRVPVKVAYSADEVVNAVAQFAEEGKDFVLIDTAGRSPNEALPLAEVSATLGELESVTRLLCVPATLSWANADHMVARFHSLVAPDALIVTKLDESADNTYLGHLLGTQAKLGLPLAFVTTGQRVPDDLSRPDSHAIAEKILPQT